MVPRDLFNINWPGNMASALRSEEEAPPQERLGQCRGQEESGGERKREGE